MNKPPVLHIRPSSVLEAFSIQSTATVSVVNTVHKLLQHAYNSLFIKALFDIETYHVVPDVSS